jgi:hypothetical protein
LIDGLSLIDRQDLPIEFPRVDGGVEEPIGIDRITEELHEILRIFELRIEVSFLRTLAHDEEARRTLELLLDDEKKHEGKCRHE